MHFSYKFAIAVAALLVASVPTVSAIAAGFDRGAFDASAQQMSRNYSGSWPVTVSGSQHSNGTYCLTLITSATNGGSASLVIGNQKYPYGTFQILNNTVVATIQAQGYGQNAGLVFVGSAETRNHIGPGVFDDVYGGEAFDEGALSFGKNGGC
jgi:hypothetical protein